MNPEDTVATIVAALRETQGARALFRSGSFGNGRADAVRVRT